MADELDSRLMPTIQASLSAQGLSFVIVASRFNSLVVEPLVSGAKDMIVRLGGQESAITTVWCPGAFELPQATRWVAARRKVDAIIVLGAVVRGATPHFDYVAGAAANGVADVAKHAPMPITFGVLTTDTMEQALDRAGGKAGNKGADAALAAIEMAQLAKALS